MSDSPTTDATHAAIIALFEALHTQAAHDAELRAHLHTLGTALLALANPPLPAPVPATTDHEVAPADTAPAHDLASPDELLQLKRFFAGELSPAPEAAPEPMPLRQAPSEPPDPAAFLSTLSSRCAQKAAAIRDPDAAPSDPALWMLPLRTDPTYSADDWAMLAGAYEALGTVLETLADCLDDPALSTYRQAGFELAAEAQSALRGAVQQVRPQSPDPDQEMLFRWLREYTQAQQIFIKQYMRAKQVAPPTPWSERLERITAWQATVEAVIYRRRHERKLLGKLNYQLKQVAQGTDAEWTRALQTIDALIDNQMQPSNRVLRGILWPHRAQLIDARDYSRNLGLVVRAIKQVHNAPPDVRPEANTERDEPMIAQVADLLRNRSVVLIGGDERPPVSQTIAEAFDLRELIWCDTRPHKSHLPLESAIARSDVAVVLLAIRWASHGLGEVKSFCEAYHKPFVRLPGGYNVSQLAYQIMQQASERLRLMQDI
jgi:hypothetical protein